MNKKRILLLGDSILCGAKGIHGYGYYVRKALAGQYDVFLPTDNCQDICYMARFADELIPDVEGAFDLIHWNNGLWDVLHFAGNPNPYTTMATYEEKLTDFSCYLKRCWPEAVICFALTTPVAEHLQNTSSFRKNAEIEAYNAAAVRVLTGRVDTFDDLYGAALQMSDQTRAKDGLHYSEKAACCLAKEVCDFLRRVYKDIDR